MNKLFIYKYKISHSNFFLLKYYSNKKNTKIILTTKQQKIFSEGKKNHIFSDSKDNKEI